MSVDANAISKTTVEPKESAVQVRSSERGAQSLGERLEQLLGRTARSLGLEGMSRVK